MLGKSGGNVFSPRLHRPSRLRHPRCCHRRTWIATSPATTAAERGDSQIEEEENKFAGWGKVSGSGIGRGGRGSTILVSVYESKGQRHVRVLSFKGSLRDSSRCHATRTLWDICVDRASEVHKINYVRRAQETSKKHKT